MEVILWDCGVIPIALFLLGLINSRVAWAGSNGLIQPSNLTMFVDDLPDMPKLRGYTISDGVPSPGFLTIGMFEKEWKFHRDIPPTRVYAYGTSMETATVPGPTIESLQHVMTHVTWQNHLPGPHILPVDPTIPTATPAGGGVPAVVHLHGGINEPASDGSPNAWFTAGYKSTGPAQSKATYTYPNVQEPGNLWYHDHALGLTRVNLLAGLIGAYVIRNPTIEAPLRLPSGDEFDRNLLVFDRNFRVNGSLYMNSTGNNPAIHPVWQPEYFGNVIIVNGKAWPQLKVRRRKYRFRIINASNARFFRFFFTNGLPLVQVSSDSVYLPHPVEVMSLLLGPSEIADVVVDFSNCTSKTVVLANDAPYPFPNGTPTDEFTGRVMRFIVNGLPETETARVPMNLVQYPVPSLHEAVKTRYIVMYEYVSATGNPTHLLLNGKRFDDPATETPTVGTTELWNVVNLTPDNHPLHVHLGLFVVVEQRQLVAEAEFKACMDRLNDAVLCHVESHVQGTRVDVPRQERGWKNVFKVMPGQVARILVRFELLQPGIAYPFDVTAEPGYVYHCHILDHEDNEMIRPLKLTY